MSDFLGRWDRPDPRPKLRRPPLTEPQLFRIRIDLAGAQPPIWRRLEVRSDLTLATLHTLIQAVFDWFDYHLYRFSIGDTPFAPQSELFLCDYDAEEADEPVEGTHVEKVRLDETIQEPRELLHYVYDYGDNWRVHVRLEQVLGPAGDAPVAVCVGGRRAAPPEDCGGVTDGRRLAKLIDDPAHFDVEEANFAIEDWLDTPRGLTPSSLLTAQEREDRALLTRYPGFIPIANAIVSPDARAELMARLKKLNFFEFVELSGLGSLSFYGIEDDGAGDPAHAGNSAEGDRVASHDPFAGTDPHSMFVTAALGAVRLLLEEIGEGVRLTQAGYLPLTVARSVGAVLGQLGYQPRSSSESQMPHVREFREGMQKAGLLRKSRGELVPTKAGMLGREDPLYLWNHLADRPLPEPAIYLSSLDGKNGRNGKNGKSRDFVAESTLIVLLFTATSNGDSELERAADMMTLAGWNFDARPVAKHHLAFEGGWQTIFLWSIAPQSEREWFPARASSAATALARAALTRMKPLSPPSRPLGS